MAALIALLSFPMCAPAKQPLFGPYSAEVLRVIDGDTLAVRVAVWPGLLAEFSVRVRGVDAPEHRTSCAEEEVLGERALAFVQELYPPGSAIVLEHVEEGEFAGRVIADVKRLVNSRYRYLRNDLLDRGHAEPWDGSPRNRVPWCLLARERLAAERAQ